MVKKTINIFNFIKNAELPLHWVITALVVTFGFGMGYVHIKSDAEKEFKQEQATVAKVNSLPDSSQIVTKQQYLIDKAAQDTINKRILNKLKVK